MWFKIYKLKLYCFSDLRYCVSIIKLALTSIELWGIVIVWFPLIYQILFSIGLSIIGLSCSVFYLLLYSDCLPDSLNSQLFFLYYASDISIGRCCFYFLLFSSFTTGLNLGDRMAPPTGEHRQHWKNPWYTWPTTFITTRIAHGCFQNCTLQMLPCNCNNCKDINNSISWHG